MRTHQRIIIAHHLIHTGYGHWLPNDLRGSGSDEIRKEELKALGDIHKGRKRVQPAREELREFYQQAEPILKHETIWFDAAKRQALGDTVAQAARQCGYTLYAFASLKNHMHSLVRRHRDDAEMIWHRLADVTRDAIRSLDGISENHPVWSHRPYKVFLYTPNEVSDRIGYIEDNPEKEGLSPQQWEFVTPYNGWPTPNLWTNKNP